MARLQRCVGTTTGVDALARDAAESPKAPSLDETKPDMLFTLGHPRPDSTLAGECAHRAQLLPKLRVTTLEPLSWD